MARENISDLLAFVAVAREKSFTRAAAALGMSKSALSHTIGRLEAQMGVRLLTRTTRSLSATEIGEQLLQKVAPRLAEVEEALAEVGELGVQPAGLIRIATIDYAAWTVLWPRLARLLPSHPDLKVEMTVAYGAPDESMEGHDIGVRWGNQVAKDMVAVRVAPDRRMVIVGSPAYLASRPPPKKPQDLLDHNCITLRLADEGGLYEWELKKAKRVVKVRANGQCTFNGVYQMLNAALSGDGVAFVPEDLAKPYVREGRLQYVLESWFPTFPGLHLYYPRRRQSSRTLALVVSALRGKH
jgi:DNA-binding transcriptional LysR family regulator